MLMRHKVLFGSAIMTLAQLAHAQTSTITPEPATPAPPTSAPPETSPMPGVTPPDVPPVPPSAPRQMPTPQPGAIVMPPERTVTVERRAQTETDTDPYIQRRIARKEARTDYRDARRQARDEFIAAKRAADKRFQEMHQADPTQSPRGELASDHMGFNSYGSTGR